MTDGVERRGSRAGERRGDHSSEHLTDNALQEEAIEVARRAERDLAGDPYEKTEIVTALRHVQLAAQSLQRLDQYQDQVEDPNHKALSASGRKLVQLSQHLREALEARTEAQARQWIRLALAEVLPLLPREPAAA